MQKSLHREQRSPQVSKHMALNVRLAWGFVAGTPIDETLDEDWQCFLRRRGTEWTVSRESVVSSRSKIKMNQHNNMICQVQDMSVLLGVYIQMTPEIYSSSSSKTCSGSL